MQRIQTKEKKDVEAQNRRTSLITDAKIIVLMCQRVDFIPLFSKTWELLSTETLKSHVKQAAFMTFDQMRLSRETEGCVSDDAYNTGLSAMKAN